MLLSETQLIFLATFCALVVSDTFDTYDTNHDGNLDKNEFSLFGASLKGAMSPFLDIGSISVGMHASSIISAGTNFVSAFLNSLMMIIVTEIGDKTFFIAAVLAMKNGRAVVLLGALSALAIMHLLSCVMGVALPALLPRAYTHYASAILFVYFGARLLKDAQDMKAEGFEELQEVEEELISKKEDDEESGHNAGHNDKSSGSREAAKGDSNKDFEDDSKGAKWSFQRAENVKVFTQAFTLTFLAEWGDRSQIATIALASSKNVFGVFIGGLIGHSLCTGLAVIGGRFLAASVSERTVALTGGFLFLAFALHSFIIGPSV